MDINHLDNIFKYVCCQCKHLREHIVKTDGNKSNLNAVTLAIIDMELGDPQNTKSGTSQQKDANDKHHTSPEVVTLDTTDMSDTENTWGTHHEIITHHKHGFR